MKKWLKNIKDNQRGLALIEVVMAIGILGIISVAILNALSGSTKAVITADQRTTAESLARAEMEYVKNLPYTSGNYATEAIPAQYVGYTVSNVAVTVTDSSGVPRAGLQKIAITVYFNDKSILTLEDYKAR
jgi:prepilin-type N-terminal cleavage/methylation domain-containing protein